MDVKADQIRKAIENKDNTAWWNETEPNEIDMLEGKDEEQIDFLQKPSVNQVEAGEIAKAAKKHSMNTDVKKAVFNAIIGADDCLQAFEAI
jgi:hypothetical protein